MTTARGFGGTLCRCCAVGAARSARRASGGRHEDTGASGAVARGRCGGTDAALLAGKGRCRCTLMKQPCLSLCCALQVTFVSPPAVHRRSATETELYAGLRQCESWAAYG